MAITSTIKLNLDSSSVKRGISDMKSRFRSFSKAAVAGMAALGVATAAYFARFAREMDRVDKLAKRFGESAEDIQRIGLAAQVSGTDIETVAKGMQRFVRAAVEASEGSETMKRSLDRLGLSADNLIDMNLDGQIRAVIRAYEEGSQGGREFASVMELLGRSGAEMMPLIRGGLAAYVEETENAKVVTSEVVEQMAAMNDELARMKQSAKAAASVGITGLLRGFRKLSVVSQGVVASFVNVGELLNDVFSGEGLGESMRRFNERKMSLRAGMERGIGEIDIGPASNTFKKRTRVAELYQQADDAQAQLRRFRAQQQLPGGNAAAKELGDAQVRLLKEIEGHLRRLGQEPNFQH